MARCVFIAVMFTCHSFKCASQLFGTEAKRKIKKEPPLAFELRKSIFPSRRDKETEDDIPSIGTDVVSELWTF